jgi:hypothetical protein
MKKRTLVCPVPLTVAIITDVFFFFPISLSIIYLIYQFSIITMATWANSPLLFFPQPQTSQHRNQKMVLTTNHKITPKKLRPKPRVTMPALYHARFRARIVIRLRQGSLVRSSRWVWKRRREIEQVDCWGFFSL